MSTLHIGLVHYPVLGKDGAVVTSAITNLDIHDIARTAKTYAAASYELVHPIAEQRALVERICDHWTEGSSARRIPRRKEALALARTAVSLDEVYTRLGGRENIDVWVTAARAQGETLSFPDARVRFATAQKPVLILFGTSWGLTPEVVAAADVGLEPIRGRSDDFYHLSVRAAVAIILDRVCGPR